MALLVKKFQKVFKKNRLSFEENSHGQKGFDKYMSGYNANQKGRKFQTQSQPQGQ